MKAFKLISLGILGAIAAQAIKLPVSAQPAQSVTRNVDGLLFVQGLTPGAVTPIIFGNSPVTRRVLANECGLLRVSPLDRTQLPSSVVYNGTTINPSTLPVGIIPSCVNSALLVPTTANFRTSTNDIVIVGAPANFTVDVQVVGSRTRPFTANGCGVVRVSPSASFAIGSALNVNGQAYLFENLQVAEAPICRRVNDRNVLYQLYTPATVGS